MADNTKEVQLKVGVATSGTDALGALAGDLRDIAKRGGDAAPALEKMAADLERLQNESRNFTAAEASARAEVQAQRRALDEKRDALARLRAESTTATRSTAEFQATERAARVAVIDGRAALRDKQAALQSATTAARAATASEKALTAEAERVTAAYRQQAQAAAEAAAKQSTAYKTVSEGLQGIGSQLRTLQQLAGAAVGGQLLGGLVGDVAKAADAFNNLHARIGLVTGQGAGLESAFAGVFEVATRTNTAVNETGNLFARIAQAGKAIGVSNADALRLTETINQAVQVSGASAESSAAAVTQLTQALQSGVLRGDEFNSLMEQAPRLAQALADGLGVTTGELRKLAEAGTLTSQTVIAALQGQAAALQAEFNQLPPTLGRALRNLSTEWVRYVGEVDKASGISAAAASAINALAKNLDTLGALLYSVGKAAAAYQALRLAETFLNIGTAAKTATTQITAMTVAQKANAAATTEAAAGVGRFAGLISGIKTFTLLGILTNFREIGTAIGEGVAKLAGYGKSLEELERRQKADEQAARAAAAAKAELAQKAQLAAEKALGLTDVSRKLIGDFDQMRTKGESAADALAKLANNLQLGDLRGIADAGAALDALAVRGKITAQDVRDSLAAALKSEDLGRFEAQARAAFDGSEQGARRLAAAIDAIVIESLRRAGTSAEELRTGFSAAATSAINDVDTLASSLRDLNATGADASRALGQALDKATEAAGTERAVRAVMDRWQELGRQGAVTGEQLAAGLERAQAKLDTLVPGVNSLSEALHNFGLKSREELQATADKMAASWEQIRNATTVSLADKAAAFAKYREAAEAAQGGVENATLRAQERMLQLEAAARSTGSTITTSMDAGSKGVSRLTSDVEGLTQSFERAAAAADAAARAQAAVNGTRTAGQIGPDNKVAYSSNYERDVAERHAQGAVDNSGMFKIVDRLNAGTLSADDYQLAKAAFDAAKFNAQAIGNASGSGLVSLEAQRQASALFEQTRRAVEITEALQRQVKQAQQAPSDSSRTVTINLGNRSTSIGVASERDANALVGMLQELEAAAGRSRV